MSEDPRNVSGGPGPGGWVPPDSSPRAPFSPRPVDPQQEGSQQEGSQGPGGGQFAPAPPGPPDPVAPWPPSPAGGRPPAPPGQYPGAGWPPAPPGQHPGAAAVVPGTGTPWPAPPPPGPPDAWRPRRYPQLLRGPNHRWWRPLAGLGVVVGLLLGILIVFAVLFAALGALGGPDVSTAPEEDFWTHPLGVLLNNLSLATLIPASMAAVWVAHGWRPRWLASVAGGMRWGWMAWCFGATAAVSLPATVALGVLDGGMHWHPEDQALWLLVVILLTTPLQAAGEEYLFRGWMVQAVGSLVPGVLPAALVSGALSSVLFALAHGEQNMWLFLDRFVFAVVAVFLVYVTGGLEAGIALHAVNNLSVMLVSVLTGTFAASLETTEADLLLVVVDVTLLVVMAALILGLARRRGVRRVFEPPAPVVVTPSLGTS